MSAIEHDQALYERALKFYQWACKYHPEIIEHFEEWSNEPDN